MIIGAVLLGIWVLWILWNWIEWLFRPNKSEEFWETFNETITYPSVIMVVAVILLVQCEGG